MTESRETAEPLTSGRRIAKDEEVLILACRVDIIQICNLACDVNNLDNLIYII